MTFYMKAARAAVRRATPASFHRETTKSSPTA